MAVVTIIIMTLTSTLPREPELEALVATRPTVDTLARILMPAKSASKRKNLQDQAQKRLLLSIWNTPGPIPRPISQRAAGAVGVTTHIEWAESH